MGFCKKNRIYRREHGVELKTYVFRFLEWKMTDDVWMLFQLIN